MIVNLNHIFIKHQPSFHAVVPFDPGKDKLLHLDFTENNRDLTKEIIEDTQKFTGYINKKLQAAGARYGIGGYGEHRAVYARSRHFDSPVAGEEPRRIHLGTDIWGKP